MFKVVDRPDGSTAILCPRTNKLLFVLKPSGGRKEVKALPVAIGRPIPQAVTNSIGQSSSSSNCAGKQKPSACVLPLPRVTEPQPTPIKKDPKENPVQTEPPDVDYSDDCISCEQFMQTLNLIPSQSLARSGPSTTQRSSFPLRNISKRPVEPPRFAVPSYAKVYEEVDLFSPLGKKWLHEGPASSRHIISDSAAKECNQKHAFYCKVSLLKPGSKDYDVPKLRCREVKPYPETFRPQKNSKGGCHMYSFTNRQRRERLKTLKTGLNSRSRKLKRLCKPVKVLVRKLDQKVIKELTARRKQNAVVVDKKSKSSPSIPVIDLEDSIDDCPEEQPSTSSELSKEDTIHTKAKSPSKLSKEETARTKAKSLSKLPKEGTVVLPKVKILSPVKAKQNKSRLSGIEKFQVRRCSVVLNDVKKRIMCVSGKYLVKGTSLRVVRYQETLNGIVRTASKEKQTPKIVIRLPSQDHPFHRIKSAGQFALQMNTNTKSSLTSTTGKLGLQTVQQVKNFNKRNTTCTTSKHSLQTSQLVNVNRSITTCTTSKHGLQTARQVNNNKSSTSCNNSNHSLQTARVSNKNKSSSSKKHNQRTSSGPNAGALPSARSSEDIPVIDLVDEEQDDHPRVNCVQICQRPVLQLVPRSTYIFHCFGCCYQKTYSDKAVASRDIHGHMTNFHSVVKPEMFIQCRPDMSNGIYIFEAFPGFKSMGQTLQ